jgi:hypothetical protein
MKYGKSGDFIKRGEYIEDEIPNEPTLVGNVDSLTNKALVHAFEDEVKAVYKNNRKMKQDRLAIYAEMCLALSDEAKSKLEREFSYTSLALSHDHPLGLWKLITTCLVSSARGDEATAKNDAMNSYSNCKQSPGMKIETYFKIFESRVSRYDSYLETKLSDADKAVRFVSNLDPARYGSLLTNIRNKIVKMPITVVEALDIASDWHSSVRIPSVETNYLTTDYTKSKFNKSLKKAWKEEVDADSTSSSVALISATSSKDIDGKYHSGRKFNVDKNVVSPSKSVSFNHRISSQSDQVDGSEYNSSRKFKEGSCNECGKFGHFMKNCPKLVGKMRETSYLTDEKSYRKYQESLQSDDEDSVNICIGAGCVAEEVALVGDDTRAKRIASLHKYEVGVDSMCSAAIFGESKLLKNIRDCPPRRFNGFAGNAPVTQIGTHTHFGDVYYLPGAPNLLSLGELEDRDDISISYDSGVFSVTVGTKEYFFTRRGGRKLFTVDLTNEVERNNRHRGEAYFSPEAQESVYLIYDNDFLPDLIESDSDDEGDEARLPDLVESDDEDEGVHVYAAGDEPLEPTIDDDEELPALVHEDDDDDEDVTRVRTGVETVEENLKLYTKKEVAAAGRARAFSAAMCHPSTKVVLDIVRSGRAEGLDFGVPDVLRAIDIYGPSLESVRGKETRKKRISIPQKAAGLVVDAEQVLHIDIAFFAGIPFLVSVAKPLGLLMAEWIKSREIKDVMAAIEKQQAKLTSEGYKVVELRSDGEGAICAMQSELESRGMRVSIHAPGTYSAEVDVKIKQLKNGVRSCTVLPYLLPIVLLMYAVYFACNKINMCPSSVNAHTYSPMEMFLGRPISLSRDLGARRGGPPLAFGSRCEVFSGTTNTMADRTRPAIWLGSKSNSFGSGLFYLLDSKRVVSRDQWKSLPMDASTSERMSEIARLGRLLPKKIPVQWRGTELESRMEFEPIAEVVEGKRVREASGGDMFFPSSDPLHEPIFTIARADETDRAVGDAGAREQQEEAIEAEEPAMTELVENGGDSSENRGEAGGTELFEDPTTNPSPRWHHPVLEDTTVKPSVEPPWFLSGEAIPSEGRAKRATRPVKRYGFDALWLEDSERQQGIYREGGPVVVTERYSSPKVTSRPSAGAVACRDKRHARERRESASKFSKRGRKKHVAFILTTGRAIRNFGQAAIDSMIKELTSIHSKEVITQVFLKDLTEQQRRKVIYSSMFLKEKYVFGEFEKLKSRLVAGGNLQDKSDYSEEETSSPTVSLQSLYLTISLAAKEGRKVGTMDVGTAYLNAVMKREVLMRIEPKLASLLVDIDPSCYALEDNGCIVVRLNKALYGCLESAKLWYDDISATLRGMGFTANRKDPCVLNVMRGGHQVTVNIYVDDVLCTSVDQSDIDWVATELKLKYGELTVNTGMKHSYLGQTLDFSSRGEVSVSMESYVRDVLELYSVSGTRATPAGENLYDVSSDLPVLGVKEGEEFHSRVAKLLYVAQRARPDILTAVAFLTTRVKRCTSEDEEKLDRVLKYLNGTPSLGLKLKTDQDLTLFAYVDASFAVHEDMKSHTGAMMTLGKGPIYVSSKKQGLMTKSSTESELVGMSDVLPQVLWTRDFLMEQGYEVPPAIVYQDNTSTITLAAKGHSRSARTRHIGIRYFFVKDRVDRGEVRIVHMPTEEMIADIMTKPLQGGLFRKMRAWLMGQDE